MDCCVCGSMYMFRPPRNAICATCFEGAKSLLTVLNMRGIGLDNDAESRSSSSSSSKPNSSKTLMNVWRGVTAMRECTEELKEKIEFLSGLVGAFKDQIHTDIFLKPGNNTNDVPPIPAHKALMAVRSEIFKNMLESDSSCKEAAGEAVTVPEMSHGELETLLEFLYGGALPEERMKEHVYMLAAAADKYNIQYLRRVCERHMVASLSPSTALDVLEVSELCSYVALKDAALRFIVKNMQEIAFSPAFDAFALKNPHLCVQITRASFKDTTNSHRNRYNIISDQEELFDGFSTTTTSTTML